MLVRRLVPFLMCMVVLLGAGPAFASGWGGAGGWGAGDSRSTGAWGAPEPPDGVVSRRLRPVAVVASYLDHLAVERGVATNTLSSYRRDLNRYLDFLAAAGQKIEPGKDKGTWTVDDKLTVKLSPEAAAEATVRDAQNGVKQLVVPVKFNNGAASFEVEMSW